MLLLPLLERLVVAALGLNELTRVGVAVDLDCSLRTRFARLMGNLLSIVRVKNRDDVTQALAILRHQGPQLFLELHLFQKGFISAQLLQLWEENKVSS